MKISSANPVGFHAPRVWSALNCIMNFARQPCMSSLPRRGPPRAGWGEGGLLSSLNVALPWMTPLANVDMQSSSNSPWAMRLWGSAGQEEVAGVYSN